MTKNIAILGATGAVGVELLELLEERHFPVGEVRLLASARSAGKRVRALGRDLTVEEVSEKGFSGVDLAFFAAGSDVSRKWAPIALEQGAVVIDNSNAYRMDPEVPLVVPEVNPEDIANHRGIIANPNCSTIIMVVALQPLHQAAGIKRVVVSTYQAVSGVGAAAIAELEAQTHAYVAGEEMPLTCFPSRSAEKHYQMLFNVIPQIDVFLDNGYTKEEMKMVNETRKIMHLPELKVTATTVRVPVMRSHSESINVELERSLSVEEARDILSKAPGVKVVDNPKSQEYPMPLDTTKQDDVFVGRIRIDDSVPAGLNLWVVGDQIRKGAALNAIQIAECLL